MTEAPRAARLRVAVLYEHPTWSRELIERLADRGVDLATIDVGEAVDPDVLQAPRDVWLNRVNAMPSAGRPTEIVAATQHLLWSLDVRGARVVNGARSHAIATSKVAQAALFTTLGLATPRTVAIHAPEQAEAAAAHVGYPVLTKPNVGGSGSGIVRHDDEAELLAAVSAGRVDLGVDGTGIVQEVVDSVDGLVHRVEVLAGELFYATDQLARPGEYNYCAADGCAVLDPDSIAIVEPHPDVVSEAVRAVAAAGADVAGVEYLIDRRTGTRCYYDLNPYSNFVRGRDAELGFDPIDRYLDAVLDG